MFRLPIHWVHFTPQPPDDFGMPIIVELSIEPSLFADLTTLSSKRQMPIGLIVGGLLHSNTCRQLVRANLASLR